ncbi:MAG: hypothetical protein M3258_08220 [Thermoproteota archaeon]|nr:hypothetical protein [Thermoproteota archaeon]
MSNISDTIKNKKSCRVRESSKSYIIKISKEGHHNRQWSNGAGSERKNSTNRLGYGA